MPRSPLTPRPRAPVLVRATAVGTLALASLSCGDDGSTTSVADSDVHPTAGPCAHDPQSPECGTTGDLPGTTAGTMVGTGATSVADSTTTDEHPTAGPCAHDPQDPECATGTGTGSGSGSDTATAGTDTDAGTGTGSTGAG